MGMWQDLSTAPTKTRLQRVRFVEVNMTPDTVKRRETRKMKSVNCEGGGSKEDRRHAKTHPASSSLCPSYVSARARLMGSTFGVTMEQKNAYLTRAWEDLKLKRRGGSAH